jgi:hypothetical protein
LRVDVAFDATVDVGAQLTGLVDDLELLLDADGERRVGHRAPSTT